MLAGLLCKLFLKVRGGSVEHFNSVTATLPFSFFDTRTSGFATLGSSFKGLKVHAATLGTLIPPTG
jgi:hypothetical protein